MLNLKYYDVVTSQQIMWSKLVDWHIMTKLNTAAADIKDGCKSGTRCF